MIPRLRITTRKHQHHTAIDLLATFGRRQVAVSIIGLPQIFIATHRTERKT